MKWDLCNFKFAENNCFQHNLWTHSNIYLCLNSGYSILLGKPLRQIRIPSSTPLHCSWWSTKCASSSTGKNSLNPVIFSFQNLVFSVWYKRNLCFCYFVFAGFVDSFRKGISDYGTGRQPSGTHLKFLQSSIWEVPSLKGEGDLGI